MFLVIKNLIFILSFCYLFEELKAETKVNGNLEERIGFQTLVQQKDNSSLRNSYDEEYKVFENLPKRRRKRFIYYNIESQLDVGFFLVTPITIVLPSMSNLFNKWRRRRSLQSMEEPGQFQDHELVQPHLDKMSSYFDLIDIPEHHCQLRALCEFSADPSKFYPISDIILGRLRHNSIPSLIAYDEEEDDSTHPITIHNETSLFKAFKRAAAKGIISGTEGCEINYGQGCKYPMEKLLSLPSLRILKGLRSVFGLHMKEHYLP